jgi:general secretion pathway protein H
MWRQTTTQIKEARGFTLIEMMVVVVIIGIMINYAVLSFGNNSPSDQLKTEATRLKSLLKVAEEEALLRSSLIGVDILEDGYGFLYLEDGEWQPVDDNLFRNRTLPDDMQITLIEGQPPGDDKEKRTPEIILLNSGEMTPFELKITSLNSDDYYRLTGSETGDLTLDKVTAD